MTQEQVAEKGGMHSTYISHLEQGKRNPTLRTLKSLAGALDIDCSKILALEEVYAEKGSRIERSESG
jgi:transcriptional regulator with XRE-family HTH domain